MQMSRWPRTRGTSGRSINPLFGHLFTTSAAFVTLFTLNWIVSLLFNYLNSIHPFAPAIFKLVTNLEVELFYVDSIGCGAMLVSVIIRVFLNSLEGR
jgi:hypothetical protein